jgi:mRNA interferase RelE/StbE
MRFKLGFLADAFKEWQKLDSTTRAQFKAKLTERLDNPCVAAAKMSGHHARYKIKLLSAGYRLVYEVRDTELVVVVIAVGKRERNAVYLAAAKRG